MSPLRLNAPLLLLAAAILLPSTGRSQVPASSEIRPTVTVETGDTGGLLFGRKPEAARTRHYYVAAESELWDYAPSGRDEMCGGPLPPHVGRERKGGKLRYVQYTDATFTAKVIPNRSLGIMGPVLRGVVGEYLAVTFLNRTGQPLSMHPHGLKYDKDNEGAYYTPSPGRGAAVGPGARFTYVWQLDENSGPMPDEPSSKAWLYHSHGEANLGLMGAIIVTDPKRARPDGTPNDVDRELATLFMIFDESGLDADAIEAAEYGPPVANPAVSAASAWADVQQRIEQGSRFTINGLVFGNLPGLQVNEGERIRWYLLALGSEQDLHTAHWHGLRVVEEGRRRTDVIELLPASMKVADFVADNPGTWMFHCHVDEHMRQGMFAQLVVHGRDQIGVDRSPQHAFLGYPDAATSLRIDAARVTSDRRLQVSGAVTVFPGFAVFNEPMSVRVGDQTVDLTPDQKGRAATGNARLHITNVNEFGVLRDGLMEFELELQGDEWLRSLASPSPGSANQTQREGSVLALEIDVARGRHIARRQITPSGQR